MDRVISFLIFAVFFYVMMRFGCGAHRVHGHHRREESAHRGEAEGGESKDPVCGMTVDEGGGYSEIYGGRSYRFCSRKCLDQFDANPAQFAHA